MGSGKAAVHLCMSNLTARRLEKVSRSLRAGRGGGDESQVKARYSLRWRFEQLLHRASLVVFQQREVEAVLVRAAAPATGALIQGLGLHQRAVGVVEDDKTLGAGGELGKHV